MVNGPTSVISLVTARCQVATGQHGNYAVDVVLKSDPQLINYPV